MAVSRDDTKSMVLTLSAEPSSGIDVLFPERRITLTRGSNTITIGRASKVSTKGFIAAADNAWFDSPVMSRLHARLSAEMDEEKVTVTDLGSLHGTFVNENNRVEGEKPWSLKNGDILQLGTAIWHSTKQFLPMKLRVGLQFPHRDRPRSFRVPESDDDGSECEEIGVSKIVKRPGIHPISAEGSAGRTPVGYARSLNLSSYRFSEGPNIIDLSSPSSSPIPIDDDDDVNESFIEVRKNKEEGRVSTRPASPDLGVPMNSQPLSCEADGLDNTADVFPPDGSNFDATLSWSDLDEAGYEEAENDLDENNLDMIAEDDSEVDYPDDTSDSQLDDYDQDDSDEAMDHESTDADDSEDDYASDGNGLNSLSPAEDMRESMDLPYNPWNSHLRELEYPEMAPLIESLSQPVVAPPPAPANVPRVTTKSDLSIMRLRNIVEPVRATPSPMADHLAQESPNAAGYESPSRRCYSIPSSRSAPVVSSAEALGAKTGKVEFFKAREDNKRVHNSQTGFKPSISALCNMDTLGGPCGFAAARQQTTTAPKDESSILPPLAPLDVMAPEFPPPGNCMHEYRDPPQFSVDFLSVMGSPVSLDEEGQPRRTESSDVPDVGQESQDGLGTEKLKRKAEDISEATLEQDQWLEKATKALSPAPSVHEEMPDSPEEEQHIAPLEEVSQTSEDAAELFRFEGITNSSEPTGENLNITSAAPSELERPVKRARVMRVAERLGYAALGGVTAGAMIMGTLIYTAPTF